MQTAELLKDAKELRQIMVKAKAIAEVLHSRLPELEEPAMSAQCNVIRHFLYQTERQEQLLVDMLSARQAG